MLYCSWDIVRDRYNYFSFWAIFCPFTLLTAQKIKISKTWEKRLKISSFYTYIPKIMIRSCTVPEIWCVTDGRMDWLADGRTDVRKKWHIEVGAPPKKRTRHRSFPVKFEKFWKRPFLCFFTIKAFETFLNFVQT